MIRVEVVYIASGQKIVHLKLELASGATVVDALNSSRIYALHPETQGMAVGIYAKLVSLDTVLKDNDRIEVYRPLALDPKEKRRRLAKTKS